MGFLAWIVLGLVAGAIAKLLMPGRDPGGWIVTMLIGIVGAFLGGFIGRQIWGSTGVTGLDMGSIGLAILGSVVLLLLYRLIAGRGRASNTIDRGRRAA